MIAFKNKVDLMAFFAFIVKGLEKELKDSAFELNLSILPIDANNVKVVFETFQAYQKSQESVIEQVGLDINT